jgi:hypothetical protein
LKSEDFGTFVYKKILCMSCTGFIFCCHVTKNQQRQNDAANFTYSCLLALPLRERLRSYV